MHKINVVLLLSGVVAIIAMALTGVLLRTLHVQVAVWWDAGVYFVLAFILVHRLVLKRWPHVRRW